MSYLLVDDGDGRVLAELENATQALRLLERVSRRNEDSAGRFSLVEFRDAPGSLVGASSSSTVRVLSAAPGVPDTRGWS